MTQFDLTILCKYCCPGNYRDFQALVKVVVLEVVGDWDSIK